MFSLEQMSEILFALPDPAFILTRTGRYAAIFGGVDTRYYHDGNNLVGLFIKDVLNKEKTDWFINKINLALDTNKLLITEYSLSGDDVKGIDNNGPDNVIFFEGRIQALNFLIDGEDAVLWVASNITGRHKLEEELRVRSETDTLTGLWNRRYFYSMVAQERERACRCREDISLLLLDIDHFKLTNDQYGHKSGDTVLRELSTLLVGCTRELDIVVRWGGEEFVVLLPCTGLDAACSVAEKLRYSVELYQFSDVPKVTVSVGYAQWDFEKETIDELIAKADAALYLAKNGGRNQVKCHQSSVITF